jgi:hypothetical protein
MLAADVRPTNTIPQISRPRLCVACGEPTLNGSRWCSNRCFYEEDGWAHEDRGYRSRDEAWDVE